MPNLDSMLSLAQKLFWNLLAYEQTEEVKRFSWKPSNNGGNALHIDCEY